MSDNATVHAATHPTSDVLVKKKGGQLAVVQPPKAGPISTDPVLDVCVGGVFLEDGLTHFADADAIAGTLEERSLIKAFDDGDPATLDVFVVPSFGGDARIVFVDVGEPEIELAAAIDEGGQHDGDDGERAGADGQAATAGRPEGRAGGDGYAGRTGSGGRRSRCRNRPGDRW